MKKYTFSIIAVSALAVLGCQKETVKDATSETITLNGIYMESLESVKSDYDLVGDTYNFKWVTGDKFIAQSYNSSTTTYGSSLFTASSGDAAQVPFTGTPDAGYELGDYAFYPNLNDGVTSTPTNNLTYKNVAITPISVGASVTSETATIALPGTNVEDKNHPMAHIPMIGVKNSSGDYEFHPCTGVLKITIKNLPTTATKIKIDRASGSFPLNGDFVFDTNYEIKSSYVKNPWSNKYLNITSSTSVEDRSFYFPLPTGTIGAGEINISVSDGTNSLYVVTNKIPISLKKGVVTELPAFTYSVQPAKVTITGSTNDPVMNMWLGANVVKIRASISTSSTHDLSKYTTGLFFTLKQSSYHLTGWGGTDKLSGSGQYYLHWIALSEDVTASALTGLSDSRVKAYGTIPFYYLSSGDQTAINHQFKIQGDWADKDINTSVDGDYHPGSSNLSVLPRTFTLKPSDDLKKGNVMLYEFIGRSYAVAGTLSALQSFQKAEPGTPIYGTLSGTTLTLESNLTNAFWPNTSYDYYVGGYPSQNDVSTSGEQVQNMVATLSSDENYYILTFSTPYIHIMYANNTFVCLHTLVGKADK